MPEPRFTNERRIMITKPLAKREGLFLIIEHHTFIRYKFY